jgi:hypothetical protein
VPSSRWRLLVAAIGARWTLLAAALMPVAAAGVALRRAQAARRRPSTVLGRAFYAPRMNIILAT